MTEPHWQALAAQIEADLTRHNHRGMAMLREHLEPGYLLRAANLIAGTRGNVFIITGFPVGDTFETDGPAGAMALYQCCEQLGARPHILGDESLCRALADDYRCRAIVGTSLTESEQAASALYAELPPDLVIVIERPGAAADGHYYNMAGVDISARCRIAEPYLSLAGCPTIGIGDGGNEVGMGAAGEALQNLPVHAAHSTCQELIVADVSNWAAYALCALINTLRSGSPAAEFRVAQLLEYLVERGAVDGVTGSATATEDGFPEGSGDLLVEEIQHTLAHRASQSEARP